VRVPDHWCLVFADGTGQRGVREEAGPQGPLAVKNTNVFQMFLAAENKVYLETFYDPGIGAPDDGANSWTRTFRNLWSKGTGWGLTANIVDCYEALIIKWRPGMKIGFFGFSRGAYTVRCLGGVLATCGIATEVDGQPIPKDKDGSGAKRRREIAQEAVAAYKIKDAAERKANGSAFAQKYAAAERVPDVVGVFDTVKSVGLPGITSLASLWKHSFHNKELSVRVPVGLHALAIDENRKAFLPELWDDVDAQGRAAGQIIEQVWFPGVHSDVGGGYADDGKLADLALDWMLDRLRNVAHLHIPLTVAIDGNLLGKAHDERTGFGIAWLPAERSIRAETVDIAALCKNIEVRLERHEPRYRPQPLRRHPRVARFY
jgi:uncharacterized protein (DUF2235 family)